MEQLRKKTLLSLLTIVLFAFSCEKDKETAPSKTALLTGGSSKSWQFTSATPEDPKADCRPSSDREKDNTYTFFSDGTFKYDHGTVTSGSTCGDLINITGTWTFENNEKNLIVTALKDTDNPNNTFDAEVIMTGEIKVLTKDVLTLTADGYEATFSAK